jgi:hypothetical protein
MTALRLLRRSVWKQKQKEQLKLLGKNQTFLASAAGHVAKKNIRGMSLTCPFCHVRNPEPVTSSRETVRYRPEGDSCHTLLNNLAHSFIVHS